MGVYMRYLRLSSLPCEEYGIDMSCLQPVRRSIVHVRTSDPPYWLLVSSFASLCMQCIGHLPPLSALPCIQRYFKIYLVPTL